jgi:sec-independent protein translocase protein TatA
MGAFGPVHWIVLGLVVLLVFGGRGKLSGIMGDAAKGVRAFRDGLKGDDEPAKAEEPPPPPAKPLAKPAARASAPRTTKAKTTAKPAAKSRAKTKA